jgi:hypothetical protein
MKKPLGSGRSAQIVTKIAKGWWKVRFNVLTGTSSTTIDAIMAKLGRKSGSDRKIGLRIRIFQVKRVIKV